jgi:mRNA export factor
MATCGSDGTFAFWDKDSKSRVKAFERIPVRGPITCGKFSADGSMFAYAQSYDWHKGANEELEASIADCVRIHWTFLGHAGSDECLPKR